MNKCMTCRYALYDGMCLRQGKFTVLDAPACDGYEPRIDVEVSRLKAENAKLRELCTDMWRHMVHSAWHEQLPSPVDFVDRMHELGIEVENG